MEIWVLLSVVAMVANVCKVLVVNRLCGGVDSRILVLCGRVISAALLFPLLVVVNKGVPCDVWFWVVVFGTSVLTAFASVLFTEAVKKGRLSSVMPMQASVPVFTLLTLFVVRGGCPKVESVFFMAFSMAAVGYTLYQSNREDGDGDGKFVFTVYSVIAAGLFGVCTFMDKVAIGRVLNGALAYSACWNVVSAAIMMVENVRVRNVSKIFSRVNLLPVGLFSVSTVVAFYSQQYAVERAFSIAGSVVNVKSIVMLHMPIVIILGWYFSENRGSRKVLVGGLVAIIGGMLLIRSLV